MHFSQIIRHYGFFRTLGIPSRSQFHILSSHGTTKLIPFHIRSYGQFCIFSTQTIMDINYRHFAIFGAFCLPLPPYTMLRKEFCFNALAIAPAYLTYIPTTLYGGRRGFNWVEYDFLVCFIKNGTNFKNGDNILSTIV